MVYLYESSLNFWHGFVCRLAPVYVCALILHLGAGIFFFGVLVGFLQFLYVINTYSRA
ncbi:hypothetical protein CICLE_v10010142mg [Citrus x clementina]|uniref:Uncharacterized protein n=2 Tax=Citrus TaxID=2706 RepID=V4WHW4_CITCL|nr:hypothetical protein CICLE_v10010142mg [Citrus x clementina]ESR66305.1 hypothetical protein CICLE_v10010142mg [Citrus x clementina]KDO73516.1 hypothetical protein CISIN_1g035411mg [Citrus sinensis]